MTGIDIARPEDLLEEAASSLEKRVTDVQAARKPPPLIPCPVCKGKGTQVGTWTVLWGHACWICSGWGVVPMGRARLRGPFAPHPSRHPY